MQYVEDRSATTVIAADDTPHPPPREPPSTALVVAQCLGILAVVGAAALASGLGLGADAWLAALPVAVMLIAIAGLMRLTWRMLDAPYEDPVTGEQTEAPTPAPAADVSRRSSTQRAPRRVARAGTPRPHGGRAEPSFEHSPAT